MNSRQSLARDLKAFRHRRDLARKEGNKTWADYFQAQARCLAQMAKLLFKTNKIPLTLTGSNNRELP